MGHKAQRNVVVEAMKAAITASVALREEQTQFNLIVCPGYPELIQNMITLNNDRQQTAFIIGDSPLDLNSSSTGLEAWAKNSNLALDNGVNGLVSNSEYLGVYYPSGLATDLTGESVVVPPSHMMLRTIIRSDNLSYPWFAPAGVRRGLIDNVSSIGYVDTTDNSTFKSIGVTNGLRDILYENRVNPITILPGVGLVAYGQKTRAAQTSAMDRINVARLVVYLRTVLAKIAAPFIFEPNDTITRKQVASAFESVLNDVVAKRGIYDYLVVCDETNNTADRIDRNELYIDIAIKPVKAIEFVYIPVRLKNTGASLTTV
jgi:phage tail sheath protein FI